MKILSTKKLKPNQQALLISHGFTLVDYNAIEITFIDFEIPLKIENAIFTSQNGVKAFLKLLQSAPSNVNKAEIKIFSSGQKTKMLLEENGLKVTESANYSADLAQIIIKDYTKESFHFFCGEMRRDEMPNTLKASKIDCFEVITYKTILKPRKFDQKWDGILFYSPSGVESYFIGNKQLGEAIPQQVRNDQPLLICIGKTTADAALKYSDHIVIAPATTLESVIDTAIQTL